MRLRRRRRPRRMERLQVRTLLCKSRCSGQVAPYTWLAMYTPHYIKLIEQQSTSSGTILVRAMRS